MSYQKLEKYYETIKDLISLQDYIDMLNLFSSFKTYFSKNYLISRINKILDGNSSGIFDKMIENGYFHIEYCFLCEEEEQTSYFPEKKCLICNNKIIFHEEYEESFLLKEELKFSISEYNKTILKEILGNQSTSLLNDIKKNFAHLVPFVGAGISAPQGFPTWKKIIENITNELTEKSKNAVEFYLDKNDYLECFNIIYLDSQNQLFKTVKDIKKQFSEEFSKSIDCSIDSNHKDIINLDCSLIITTNYDSCLENSKSRVNYEVEILSQVEDIITLQKKETILHIHGISSGSNKDTMIVDKKDYESIYSNEIISRKLQSILGDKALLFIGYSLDDYYFMEELMKVCESNSNYVSYYAIMINADLDLLKNKLKYYNQIKIVNLNIELEIIEEREDGFSRKVLRDKTDIDNEIVSKIRILLKYIKNELYFESSKI